MIAVHNYQLVLVYNHFDCGYCNGKDSYRDSAWVFWVWLVFTKMKRHKEAKLSQFWQTLTLLALWTVKISNFENSRWQTAAILKNWVQLIATKFRMVTHIDL